MMTDTEIRIKGMEVLSKHLGLVEAERFVALIQRERFDYVKWRAKELGDGLSVEEISRRAMAMRKQGSEGHSGPDG